MQVPAAPAAHAAPRPERHFPEKQSAPGTAALFPQDMELASASAPAATSRARSTDITLPMPEGNQGYRSEGHSSLEIYLHGGQTSALLSPCQLPLGRELPWAGCRRPQRP